MDTHGGDRGCVSIMSSSRTVEEARSERRLIASQDLCNQEKLINPYHSVDAHVDALVPLRRKKQPSPQVERIVDRVWNRFVSVSECDDRLGVQDLYCAILLVYNDINKINPGPWNDPPERKEVEDMLKTFDRNHDGKLDRDDFTAFLQSFTKNVSTRISTNILLFSFLIPLLVGATRRFSERLPKVGPVVRRIPNVFFSSLVTAAIVMLGTHFRGRALR